MESSLLISSVAESILLSSWPAKALHHALRIRHGLYGSLEGCPVALAALQHARRAYKAGCMAKNGEHELRCQVEMMKTDFGTEQNDFWRVLFSTVAPR